MTYDYPESRYVIHGFMKEVKFNGQYIGIFPCDEEKGRKWGYYGKMVETLGESIKQGTKVLVKSGSVVETQYFPICGKLKKSIFEL